MTDSSDPIREDLVSVVSTARKVHELLLVGWLAILVFSWKTPDALAVGDALAGLESLPRWPQQPGEQRDQIWSRLQNDIAIVDGTRRDESEKLATFIKTHWPRCHFSDRGHNDIVGLSIPTPKFPEDATAREFVLFYMRQLQQLMPVIDSQRLSQELLERAENSRWDFIWILDMPDGRQLFAGAVDGHRVTLDMQHYQRISHKDHPGIRTIFGAQPEVHVFEVLAPVFMEFGDMTVDEAIAYLTRRNRELEAKVDAFGLHLSGDLVILAGSVLSLSLCAWLLMLARQAHSLWHVAPGVIRHSSWILMSHSGVGVAARALLLPIAGVSAGVGLLMWAVRASQTWLIAVAAVCVFLSGILTGAIGRRLNRMVAEAAHGHAG